MLNTQSTILITGAAGFIASCMASYLNKKGFTKLVLVDNFHPENKQANFASIQCIANIDRNQLSTFLAGDITIDAVIHFGARTDTTEMDYTIHQTLNVNASIFLWEYCSQKNIPFIYASSAATYGNGEFGYTDSHDIVEKLVPLNPYGTSKNEFDKYALLHAVNKKSSPSNWYGLKFFNVYGPNEYHKGRMASVIFHAFNQIKEHGYLKLFRSHHPDYQDGGQMRDFIYVNDILDVSFWLLTHLPQNGLYNLGTGKAATFLQLSEAIFTSLHREQSISYIDTPIDIRATYQYFTEAKMSKLKAAGYTQNFYSIEDGVSDYVRKYLLANSYY